MKILIAIFCLISISGYSQTSVAEYIVDAISNNQDINHTFADKIYLLDNENCSKVNCHEWQSMSHGKIVMYSEQDLFMRKMRTYLVIEDQNLDEQTLNFTLINNHNKTKLKVEF